MSVRVTPTEQLPTHHIALSDRYGRKMGLTICKPGGEPAGLFEQVYIKNHVDTTANKQTSGSSSYADFDYPYSPIVQDDLSGGRGGLDYERDRSKYFDAFRCMGGRSNKAYAGPLEQYAIGLRSVDQNAPNSVKWKQMTESQRYIYRRFTASASYTAGLLWVWVRRKGQPGNLTIAIYADNSGDVGAELASVSAPYTRMNDVLSEWLNETVSQSLTSGTAYWLVVYAAASDNADRHWKIATNDAVGSTYASAEFDNTPAAAAFDLYYRVTEAITPKTCIPYEYKEGQYFVVSEASGAPKLYQAGDRGAADSNSGQMTKLIDATKSWTANEWAGQVAMVTDGAGKLEPTQWRTITSNDSNSLTVDSAWTIAHDTTTEYVILGAKLTEITGHGLTAPVTSVLVSTMGVAYFCMGDTVTVRRMRGYNNAGAWTLEYANENSGTKAVHMVYKPQSQKIVISNNNDASGNVSVSISTNATIPDWGIALTWGTAVNVDSKYRRITSLIVYPDTAGAEAVWAFKTDLPFIIPSTGNPYPMELPEMKTVRSANNGVNPMINNVYLYFPMLEGLERFYSTQVDDVGPNLGEGMPIERRGPIVAMQGYPGRFFIAIDAGVSGYSSVMDSGGWHERYRAPKGQRITAVAFQVTPGANLDRLWIFQGNDLIWLPFPSNTTNELEDASYPFAPEWSVTLSRMHAGMFDTQKLIKKIKLQTENLEVDEATGESVCWFELDYRLNEDSEWTEIVDAFTNSPTDEVDFTKEYGVSGKRAQFRLRGYSTDAAKTPVFIAIIIGAVLRTDNKNFYGPFYFRLEDDAPTASLRERETERTAAQKLQLLEDWSDSSNDSMLLMRSVSSLCDDRMVFLNVGTRRQTQFKGQGNSPHRSDVYVLSATMQEA